MATTSDPDELHDDLEALETALVTPVVSGELTAWAEHVQDAWTKLSAQLQHHLQHVHTRQYQQISREDPELLAQVEKLREEDDAIELDRESITRRIASISALAPNFEPAEVQINQHTSKLMEDGVKLISRVRKQEVAVATWFGEAFNRDRGVAD